MRSLPEWVGKHDDERIPDRVSVRVFARYHGRCHCCGRNINVGEPWHLDHIKALINGGEHRESNLAPILVGHHWGKTKQDVAEKAVTYRKRKRHLGLHKAKRPMPGSKASKWKRKMDGTTERR